MPKYRGVGGGGGGSTSGPGGVASGRVPHSVLERSKPRRQVPTVLKAAILLGALVYFAFMLSYSQPAQDGSKAPDLSALSSGKRKAAAGSTGGPKMNGKTVAYAISVTADGPYMDGAAVLAHGIRKASADSNYGVELIAMVHPNVTTSRKALLRAGWK